jgi:hypothetical protein
MYFFVVILGTALNYESIIVIWKFSQIVRTWVSKMSIVSSLYSCINKFRALPQVPTKYVNDSKVLAIACGLEN